MIQGGNNTGAVRYNNQTVIFDTSSNTWARGSPYTVENVGPKQM